MEVVKSCIVKSRNAHKVRSQVAELGHKVFTSTNPSSYVYMITRFCTAHSTAS